MVVLHVKMSRKVKLVVLSKWFMLMGDKTRTIMYICPKDLAWAGHKHGEGVNGLFL